MSCIDAAYRLAHRYPGGVAALAARIGKNPNTLQHEVNPNMPGNRLHLDTAELMTAMSGDAEIAQALAFACNHVCIPVAPSAVSGALGPEIAAVGKEFGDVMNATLQALEDGRVTEREVAEYDRQFHEFLAAAVRLRAELASRIPKAPGLKVAK